MTKKHSFLLPFSIQEVKLSYNISTVCFAEVSCKFRATKRCRNKVSWHETSTKLPMADATNKTKKCALMH